MTNIETDVIVIGGGSTGTGIIRDLALRGLRCVLIEKKDIASGTTGRNHGLLHSGARYAVKDLESARECIRENRILKKIARHCIEDTGGLFISLPADDPAYLPRFLEFCGHAGIPAREISRRQALTLEPALNPALRSAVAVPDALIDPFRLAAANLLDAVEHGALACTHTSVVEVHSRAGAFDHVACIDRLSKKKFTVHANMLVNAAGIWGQQICHMAGIEFPQFPSKGSMLIVDYRINNIVLNRCRMPGDADIFVPGDTVSIIGTTSRKIAYDDIDRCTVDPDEVDVLMRGGAELVPSLHAARIMRAYCGVRPLADVSGQHDGRDISRGIVTIDHEMRDGLAGMITTSGGKLMTYRLMAEKAVDIVCKKLSVKTPCSTHQRPLPGSERTYSLQNSIKKFFWITGPVVESAFYRHGMRAKNFLLHRDDASSIVCECEMVTAGEISYARSKLHARDLVDLRRRTRLGMGPCQGALCAFRAAGSMAAETHPSTMDSFRLLVDFLEERYKGVKPVLWGDSLRELEFSYWIYQGLLGLGDIPGVPGEQIHDV